MKHLVIASVLALSSLTVFASDLPNTDLKCNHASVENGHDNACDKDPVTRHKRVESRDFDAVDTPAEHANAKDSDLKQRHARKSKINYDEADR